MSKLTQNKIKIMWVGRGIMQTVLLSNPSKKYIKYQGKLLYV